MANPAHDHIDDILDQWARERPGLDTEALGVVGRFLWTAQRAHDVLAEGLAAHRLQPGWFDLLAALRRAGSGYELNPTDLMRATMLSSGGMTKRLDRMAAAGLVERRPDPADRRGTLVGLTAKGKTTVDRALKTHIANEERFLSALEPADRRTLDRLVRTLSAGLFLSSKI